MASNDAASKTGREGATPPKPNPAVREGATPPKPNPAVREGATPPKPRTRDN